MPAVFFTNLALLGGLAALAIPILVHLLIKRKKQRLRFSTLQFFMRQEEQASRRRKLRNWLLLAVRLLLVTLLALAFARPFTRTAPLASGQTKRIGIFVLDRSASLQATVRGETAWNRALALARAALREFQTGDQAALVSCSARTEILSGLRPPPAITRLLEDLKAEFTGSDLADGLRTALQLATTREPGTVATLYVVSDLQKNSLANLSTVEMPADIEVKLLSGGELFASNLAIADLRFEGQVKPQALVTLQSFADESHPAAKLSILVDGREVGTASVALPAGQSTNLVLALPAFPAGWHSAEARLESNDALPADDTRYHAFLVPEPLRVLLAETKSSARIHEQDSFYVASALQPEAEPGTSVPALFTVELTDPAALAGKLAPGKGAAGYAAVVLPALRQVPAILGDALATYVRNGGGLLLFVGEGVSANRYNAEFRDLLPLKLESIESHATDGWHLEAFEKDSPLFAVFGGAAVVNLRLPEFTRRFRLSPMTPGAAPPTLAAFDDAIPLIASRTLGAGRVVLINTSADASWSDWPRRKSYVPWLHATVNYLSGRSSREAMQPSRLFTAGEDADISLGQPWKSRTLVLQRPGAKNESVLTDEEGRLPGLPCGSPGIHSVRNTNGVILGQWAVNLPPQESELVSLPPQAIQRQLVRTATKPPGNLQASLLGATTGEQEWWRVLLLAALVLLFAEVFLANRTRA